MNNISIHVLNCRFYSGKVRSTDQETIADENKLYPPFPNEEGTLQSTLRETPVSGRKGNVSRSLYRLLVKVQVKQCEQE